MCKEMLNSLVTVFISSLHFDELGTPLDFSHFWQKIIISKKKLFEREIGVTLLSEQSLKVFGPLPSVRQEPGTRVNPQPAVTT